MKRERKMMQDMKDEKIMNSNKGITLIALVITIIVLLILAAVSIATLTGENGILTQATGAKKQTEIAEAKEQAQLDIAAWKADKLQKNENSNVTDAIIKDILTGKKYVGTAGDSSFTTAKNGYKISYSELYNTSTGGSGEIPTPPQTSELEEAKNAGTVFDRNTEIKDLYGNKVTVPEGFKIAKDSATDVTGGVVIEDVNHGVTAGSQFVWIPVGTIYMNVEATERKTISLSRYTFEQDGVSIEQGENGIRECYYEYETSGYGNTIAKDIQGFKTGVGNNGGYYIGRYEVGDASAEDDRTDISGTIGTAVSKAGEFVYNYVTQPEAATLSRNMYNSTSFTSDLMNSYAWDTAVVFIQKFSDDIDYSLQTSLQDKLVKTGEATDGTNKDVRCNIYDMAGNTYEWTTETCKDYNDNPYVPCTFRGGAYGETYNVGGRLRQYPDFADDKYGFRSILYMR